MKSRRYALALLGAVTLWGLAALAQSTEAGPRTVEVTGDVGVTGSVAVTSAPPVTWTGSPAVRIELSDGGVQTLQATVTGSVAVTSAPPIVVSSMPPASAPDGGLQVTWAGSRGVYIIQADGGVQVLEVTGPSGGPVATTVDNPITLGASSEAALRTPVTCTVGRTARLDVPTTLTRLPPRFPDGGSYTGLARRTEVTVRNTDSKDSASCQFGPIDAGVAPDCATPGWGDTLYANGGSVRYEVSELYEVWCRSCGVNPNPGAVTEVTEALCAP